MSLSTEDMLEKTSIVLAPCVVGCTGVRPFRFCVVDSGFYCVWCILRVALLRFTFPMHARFFLSYVSAHACVGNKFTWNYCLSIRLVHTVL